MMRAFVAGGPVYINGRFLSKPVTGTERFAREIVWGIDRYLNESNQTIDMTILAPPGTPAPSGLSRIRFRACGRLQGHAWEQWDLWREAKDGALVSLTNSGPVLHRDQTVVIHDAAVYRLAHDFSLSYRLLHMILGRLLSRTARIATVSEFSRQELGAVLGLSTNNIHVVYNGHEHILRTQPDSSVLKKLGVSGKPYFLFVGSPVPRKNLTRAVEAFLSLQREDVFFVLVGAANAKVFGAIAASALPNNVIRPGRLSDEEIVALYQNATALIFPSLYEGFGIPPLEAMVQGCPVVASDTPAVREVCSDAAIYFDPEDVNAMAGQMAAILSNTSLCEELKKMGQKRYPTFSWATGAEKILRLLEAARSC